MEISEKLDIFFRSAIGAANEESEAILGEQTRIYEESLAEYEKMRQERFEAEERLMHKRIEKEMNRAVSEAILQQKKEYHDRAEQHREELFALVEEKLRAFRRTNEYRKLLVKKINEAKELAEGQECMISLDAEDGPLWQELAHESPALQNGCSFTVSKESFGGGIRAMIPSKNLLMDETLNGKLEEQREAYSL
ncbi:MAG: hypothetical protein HDQ95_07250 [Roseburia sp.]|nr:hypothetical protein [Roseburia sp.]